MHVSVSPSLPSFICLRLFHQVMFIQNKGHVTMTIELLDTEEAQADDPLDVQVREPLDCLSQVMNHQ